MKIIHEMLTLSTGKGIEILNITSSVQEIISKYHIYHGQVLIFSRHTTTALAINENEPRLLEDIKTYLKKLAPETDSYLHNDLELRPNIPEDEPRNAHSHLMAMTLNNSETVPIMQGKLALGTYQSILFIELDGAKERIVFVQIVGDVL